MNDLSFAIVDVETTGSSPTRDRIIDIGILKVQNGKVVEEFKTVIDPEKYIPDSIYGLTGISEKDIRNAPTFNDVAQKIHELLSGSIFVAHNARFDYGFIKNELKRHSIPFQAKCLCTVKLSRALYPEHKYHDLTSVIDRFHFTCKARHRAWDDAKVLWDFLKVVRKKFKDERMVTEIKKILKTHSTPVNLPQGVLDGIPETSGVYIFYGEEGERLYIGKSINLRHRVLSHFAGDHLAAKEMHIAQQVRDIETIETAGELGALLLESELIKTYQPLYNRRSRRAKDLVYLKRSETADGFYTTKISITPLEEVANLESVVGVYRSVRQAKTSAQELAKEYELCPKLLGLENTPGACFYYQLGKCRGACAHQESAEAYNMRFDEAVAERKLRNWPFKGPVTFKEEKDEYEGSLYIVDNWQLIKAVNYNEVGESEFLKPESAFDYETYKILASYISKKKKSSNQRGACRLAPGIG